MCGVGLWEKEKEEVLRCGLAMILLALVEVKMEVKAIDVLCDGGLPWGNSM